MTLPFENNTTQVIKQLAKRSLSSEKRRNILLILTIALAAFLMSTVGTAIFSTGAMQKKMSTDTYEIVYPGIMEGDLQNLREQPEIARAGLQYSLGTDNNNDTGGLLSVIYGDEDALYAGRHQSQIVEGTYPQKSNEAAVSSAYLKKFFPGSGVGDQITVPFEGKEYPFTVSAILSSPDTGVEAYSVLVSQSFLKEQPGYDPSGYNAYVHFKGADGYNADDLKNLGMEIRDRLGLRSVSYSSIYFSVSRTIQPENILQLTAVVLVVMLGGSMVIRSIFRISILEKIQSYGQLRTLGATKRQIKRLVRRESRFLSLLGIPIGVLAGIAIGTLLATNLFASGFSLKTDLAVALATALVSYGMVSLSVRKPVKIAANISPMEALRLTDCQKAAVKARKARRFTPLAMAARNLERDRKRVISVLVSLTFGGLLLVVSASVFGSYSPEQHADIEFPYGHFRLYLDDPERSSYEQMKDSPFTQDFKQELLSIDGVEQVQTLRRNVGGCDFKAATAEGGGMCDILTKEGLSLEGDWAFVAQHLTSGRMPENDREILIADAYANNPDSQNFIQLGEEIELETEEKTMTVTMVGTFGGAGSGNGSYALDAASVMITEGLAKEMISSVKNFDYTWVISADPGKEDSVTAALESAAANAPSGMGLYTYAKGLDFLTFQQTAIFGGLQGLSWMIFLFGVVNLTNMILSNQLSRRRELCMMRSVGMTRRQLYQVLTSEGMFYVLFSTCIALVVGTPVAVWICRWMGEAMMGQVLAYQFPMRQMLLYIGVLVVLELLLSIWTIRKQEKSSLIEQMRIVE
ncbi:FtsX-like permease family protein [Allofournierella sp.]|uniref:ABC transporter permease n=1 Tax=Allofournierella sp. TaxID=1940256 RepID=UPI003AB199D1